MSTWEALAAEFDRWGSSGRPATLWWRDDDAVAPTPALERMIGLSDTYAVPLVLAVIPATLTLELGPRIASSTRTHAVQHGWRHENHAAAGTRASEFPEERAPEERAADIAAGYAAVRDLPRFEPYFVPPWNRCTPKLHPQLAAAGLRGISGWGARGTVADLPHAVHSHSGSADPAFDGPFTVCNTHADIITWKTTRGFVGEAKVLTELVQHLAARRTGAADATEPTGLLTHHLVHDSPSWHFLDRLFQTTVRHGTVRWLSVGEAFAAAATVT